MDIGAWIVSALDSGPVQGSRLGEQLKLQFPDWTPQQAGARNLREFIELHVDGVSIVGWSGMDVVYGLEGHSGYKTPQQQTHLGIGHGDVPVINLWRVWTSPQGPFSLSVNRITGDVQQVNRGSNPEDNCILLEPASPSVHERIANDFVESLPESTQGLMPAVGATDTWWRTWQRSLKTLGLENAWYTHRLAALKEELRGQLFDADLSEDAVEHAVEDVLADYGKKAPSSNIRLLDHPQPTSMDDRSALEAVIRVAIRHMDLSDLRNLKVPVGSIIDLIDPQKLG